MVLRLSEFTLAFAVFHKLSRFKKIALPLSEIQEASDLEFARSMAYT